MPFPRLHLLHESQLGDDTVHSIMISWLRGLAALQVAAAHLRADFMPSLRTLEQPALWYQGLAFATGFAHHAVILFFLISGWLVGGSLLNKWQQPDALKLYAIDRLTRLWTVLLPTFFLVLALGILTGVLDPRSVDFSTANPWSGSVLLGNLVGLQTITLPEFGGNFPLWSLANESWYYLMFPLALLLVRGPGRLAAGAALLLALVCLPTMMVVYFSIWLLGAGFSRVRIDCGAATRTLLIIALGSALVVFRFIGSNDDLVWASVPQDLLLSLLCLALLSSCVIRAPRTRAVARWRAAGTFLSNFSFTLYVVHVPLFGLFGWLGGTLLGRSKLTADNPLDLAIYGALLILVMALAYGFYLLFEARTGQVRRWLRNQLVGAQPGLRAM